MSLLLFLYSPSFLLAFAYIFRRRLTAQFFHVLSSIFIFISIWMVFSLPIGSCLLLCVCVCDKWKWLLLILNKPNGNRPVWVFSLRLIFRVFTVRLVGLNLNWNEFTVLRVCAFCQTICKRETHWHLNTGTKVDFISHKFRWRRYRFRPAFHEIDNKMEN